MLMLVSNISGGYSRFKGVTSEPWKRDLIAMVMAVNICLKV